MQNVKMISTTLKQVTGIRKFRPYLQSYLFRRGAVLNRRRFGNMAAIRARLDDFIRHKAAYEGEGKTTIRVLNNETDLGLMIDSFATFGFRLNNGVTVLGPMAIFPRTVLSWQVQSAYHISPEALRLFKLLQPKIDLLVIGLETEDRKINERVFLTAKQVGLNVEILTTEHACSTFNFLNAEGRSVAGAIMPPLMMDLSEDDMLQSKLHYDNLYKKEYTA